MYQYQYPQQHMIDSINFLGAARYIFGDYSIMKRSKSQMGQIKRIILYLWEFAGVMSLKVFGL
jgi:hypothetical protein